MSLGAGDLLKGGRRLVVGKKGALFGLLVLCSLGFLAASVEAGVIEKWHMVQRVRWTSNHGKHGYQVYEGELWVTVAGTHATSISSKGSGYLWDGAFTAATQPWRDPAVKVNHLVFDALTPAGGVVVGDLRPNWNWKRLTGKITATETDAVDPATSYYYEITVTATYTP
jgi:hypothetical protein